MLSNARVKIVLEISYMFLDVLDELKIKL